MSPYARSPDAVIFLDVDGTLLPFRARDRSPASPDNPLLSGLDPADGRRLLALGCDLVWATTWEHEANAVIAPRLGLPALPVVEFGEDPIPGPLHWKTPALVTYAAGRPFVWLDDEITDHDRRWVNSYHPHRLLLHRVDPDEGLTASDFAAVENWLH